MAATRYKPATVLVVNTLTSKPGETPHAFLDRNGLDAHLLQDMQLVLFPEFGVPQADRNDRFNGFTMAVLELRVPEGREVPLQNGLAFSPSKVVRLASGESCQQRLHLDLRPAPGIHHTAPTGSPKLAPAVGKFSGLLDAINTRSGAGDVDACCGCHDSHFGQRGHRHGQRQLLPKKSMAQVGSVGQRNGTASQPQAEPINHHHPSGSLGRPGRLDRGRSLPVCEGPSSLARGLLPHQRHLGNAPKDNGP